MASLFSQKLSGLCLTLGLGAIGFCLTSSYLNVSGLLAAEPPTTTALLHPPARFCPKPFTIEPDPEPASGLLPDGIYLYGQSPQPDRVENEYFVFELQQGKVIGVFYLPRSAFYCFYGTLQSTQLDVTVVDTFNGTTSPYSVKLEKYHRISTVSDNDQRILYLCKTTYQRQGWGR